MLFSSISFLYLFLPATVILYYLAGTVFEKTAGRKWGVGAGNLVLLLASLFFYAWGEPRYVLIMLAEIAAGYLFGLAIGKCRERALGKWFLWASILLDLGLLGYFKYADFFLENLGRLTGRSIKLLGVALPIGISFYTFQIMSYTVDVYRGNVRAQKNPLILAAYVAMFPQLIAGPIVRYIDIEKQLADREHTFSKAAAGARRFTAGLAKKVLIANALGELCNIFRDSGDLSVAYYWIYAAAFTLHIYFDFSGYSDMAIGLGKIFGLELLENFNYPYISKSITEFWRRWHISLGSWFRDYVYIPLGGNRVSKVKWLRNILIVWFLTGFWHGAAWNFIVWGLFYGALLLLEKFLAGAGKEVGTGAAGTEGNGNGTGAVGVEGNRSSVAVAGMEGNVRDETVVGNHRPQVFSVTSVLRHVYVLFAVILGFVIFNASDLGQAMSDIGGMFGISAGGGRLPLVSREALYYLRSYGLIFVISIIGSTPLPKRVFQHLEKKQGFRKVWNVLEAPVLLLTVLLVTAYLVDGSFNPFLYFRF